MDRREKISLNDPAFAGRLRHDVHRVRSSAYAQRPTYQTAKAVIQDMVPAVSQKTPSQSGRVSSLQPVIALKQPAGKMMDVLPARATTQRMPVAVAPSPPSEPVTQVDTQIAPEQTPVVPQQIQQPEPEPVSVPEPLPETHFEQVFEELPQPKAKRRLFRRAQPVPQEVASKQRKPILLYAMATAIFVIGVTVSLNGMRANRQVEAQAKHLSQASQSSDDEDSGAQPSTTKPSDSEVSGYVVAPNLPRYIDIPKLSVHARILSLGVTNKNQLKAPGNVHDAGWYNASAQPGQPGGMLIDGHVSSWSTKGVFYGVNKLVSGDPIMVTRGDGQQFTYKVIKTAIVNADDVDMASLLVSQEPGKPGLNLISCFGDVIPDTNEFNKRVIVYASLQS